MTMQRQPGGTDDEQHGAGRAAEPASTAAEQLADEELMRRLTGGEPDALGPLYGRYGRLVFAMASQSVDRSVAEELVQEVFLVVWRKAETFDPARGAFRSWLLEIAHTRILNELRRRSRRPVLLRGDGESHLNLVVDPSPDPSEAVEREQRQRVIREALDTLPPNQQDALWLAFFAELTHEQVATSTAVPLGTAKTRIRTGLRRLRSRLSPLLVGSLGIALVAGVAAYANEYEQAARNARALRHVTLSDVQSVRLLPSDGTTEAAHGIYRARPGANLAVLTVSYLPPLTDREVYQAWARIGGSWRSLGTVQLTGSDGSGLLIADGIDLGTLPDAVMVTREPAGGASTPSQREVIVWTAGPASDPPR